MGEEIQVPTSKMVKDELAQVGATPEGMVFLTWLYRGWGGEIKDGRARSAIEALKTVARVSQRDKAPLLQSPPPKSGREEELRGIFEAYLYEIRRGNVKSEGWPDKMVQFLRVVNFAPSEIIVDLAASFEDATEEVKQAFNDAASKYNLGEIFPFAEHE